MTRRSRRTPTPLITHFARSRIPQPPVVEVKVIVGNVFTGKHLEKTQPTYAIVVFMTSVTTILAPPVLRYLLRKQPALVTA
jgi:hypothetical protein